MAQDAIRKTSFVADEVATDKPQTKENNIVDYTTGAVLDAKTVRVKIASEQAAGIELLKQHFSAQVGHELNLSELLVILVNEELKQQFSVSTAQLTKALQVRVPKFEMPDLQVGGLTDG